MNHWSILQQNAQKYLKNKEIYKSPIRNNEYEIVRVEDQKIIIKKLSVNKNVSLSKDIVDRAGEKLKSKKRIPKTELIHSSVVRETTFIQLHPNARWDKFSKEFYWEAD
jgi:hypothetical protein